MTTFLCSVCFDDRTQSTTPKVIAGNFICDECSLFLVPQFEAALASESNYPVMWGSTQILVADFADMFQEHFDFVARYHQREYEYNTGLADRVYCRNRLLASSAPAVGVTVAQRLALTPAQASAATSNGTELVSCDAMAARRSESADQKLLCSHCGGHTCRDCEQPLFSSSTHSCVPHSNSARDDIYSEPVRGRDYQICPKQSCGCVYELFDGCNHITCPLVACKTHFCFICGEEASPGDGTDHWASGKPCPQYNQPGAGNDPYEGDDEGDDQGEEFDEEAGEGFAEGSDWESDEDEPGDPEPPEDFDYEPYAETPIQPLLEVPPRGWFETSERMELNALRYITRMTNEVDDYINGWPGQYPEEIDADAELEHLANRLRDSLEAQYATQRLLRPPPRMRLIQQERPQEVAGFLADRLENHLDRHEDLEDSIRRSFFVVPMGGVNQNLPMLAHALRFYRTHRKAYREELREKLGDLRMIQITS